MTVDLHTNKYRHSQQEHQGFFISLEGGEGSGKTTVIERLRQEFEGRGLPVVITREPGGIDIAEQIRAVILDPANVAMDGRTEALLYAAARRQHLVEKVVPALERGEIVICDRFIDSSLAYQGYARGLGIDEIWSVNQFATGGLLPDITLYLDVDPQIGLSRIQANKQREVNRLDLERLDFHHKVREGYRQVAALFPQRIHMIDAGRDPDRVFEQIMDIFAAKQKDFKGFMSK